MDRFLDLLEESVLMTGIISLLCVSTMLYLVVQGKPVPDVLVNVVMVVVGFFFGGKVQQANTRLANTLRR